MIHNFSVTKHDGPPLSIQVSGLLVPPFGPVTSHGEWT